MAARPAGLSAGDAPAAERADGNGEGWARPVMSRFQPPVPADTAVQPRMAPVNPLVGPVNETVMGAAPGEAPAGGSGNPEPPAVR